MFQLNEHQIFWSGVSGNPRFETIQDLENCINSYGFIDDFKEFSDLDLGLHIEVETKKYLFLLEHIKEVIHLDEPSELPDTSKDNQSIMLHVSFLAGTGDLKIEVPGIPG